jgi:hypothetical protein
MLVDTLYISFEDDGDGLTRERAVWVMEVEELVSHGNGE